MSVTTKAGDKGRTSLYFGGSVSKDDLRVDFFGDLDELCSFLGVAKSLVKSVDEKKTLKSIQVDLFTLGAEIAAEPLHVMKLKIKVSGLRIEIKLFMKLLKAIPLKAQFSM